MIEPWQNKPVVKIRHDNTGCPSEDPDFSSFYKGGPPRLITVPLTETADANFPLRGADNSRGSHTFATHRYLKLDNFPQ